MRDGFGSLHKNTQPLPWLCRSRLSDSMSHGMPVSHPEGKLEVLRQTSQLPESLRRAMGVRVAIFSGQGYPVTSFYVDL